MIDEPTEVQCGIVVNTWREFLGLKPWDEWAAEVAVRNADHARKEGVQLEPERRSGRSTRASLEALSVAFWTESSAIVVEGTTGLDGIRHDIARLEDLARSVSRCPMFGEVRLIKILPCTTPERARPRLYVTYRDHWQDERPRR